MISTKYSNFYNGQDALDCINNMKIDLAILDIMLPDIDGFQILKQIRSEVYIPGDHADGEDGVHGQDHRTYAGSG